MVDTVYIVETTLSGELNEAEIGYWSQSMIDTKLVACVNIEKITSIYRWEGKIQSNPEWKIQLFTTAESKDKVISKIKSEHSYDLPKVLCWPTESTKEYSNWVKGE
ncbi:MAG: divalent-cation tolerance protein CutA [Euryarchaeota archaeon]|jgi:periplasmic divalent cation tolerance protein|nr:divalent-cation tolerance protein CutA [Euryarchaeota archaeon]MBT6076128.1 divalent-cation tolerance protein CutA [Euryarchaeota archaeon]DAC61243.1 MAG TPA: divalent-cation tolerance protein CutA [Candidatus Poseidoniales archaeon]HII13300.1 divalent-cation tolerance protein CutA [Candidatus Thalassarchaeaceae archaeon]